MKTIRDVTYDLLRAFGITTIFGNVGSTEETFLQDFPSDFRYVLGLQEASVVGMADGYAQATRRPALVNIHTGAGLGNAMGTLLTAYQNKTPLIVTAGQQTREMLLMEPWLTNVEPTMMPKPWVKWAYEPARAEDVPAAFMRAIATALQPPAGPVFLSLPLDDWHKPALGPAVVRSVATRVAPDHDRLAEFADILKRASSPVLIYGASIARSEGWNEAIAFAEALGAPVWAAPACEHPPFPEDHRLYSGGLPFAIGPLSKKLEGHDVALVVGAPVFRYYPYAAGPHVPDGLRLLHISDDPSETARAPVGDSLLGDSKLSLAGLIGLCAGHTPKGGGAREKLPHRMAPHPAAAEPPASGGRLTPAQVFAALQEVRPAAHRRGQRKPVECRRLPSGMADHRTGHVLYIRERRPRLEPSRLGRRGVGRKGQRPQPSGAHAHRRRLVPVLRAVDLDCRPAPAADPVCRAAQRGILHPESLRRLPAQPRGAGLRSPRA